jgi:hypothetical protein
MPDQWRLKPIVRTTLLLTVTILAQGHKNSPGARSNTRLTLHNLAT